MEQQADNPVLPAAATTAQPMAMQLALERMERRLLEERMRMERRLDAERAAKNLLEERMARKEAQAESEKKILEERMARKQLETATDKQLLLAQIANLKEAQLQQQQQMANLKETQQQQIANLREMTSMKEAQQQQIVRLEEKIEKAAMLRQIRELQKDLAHLSSRAHSPTFPENSPKKRGGSGQRRAILPPRH